MFSPVTVLLASFLQCVTAQNGKPTYSLRPSTQPCLGMLTFDVGLKVLATNRHMNSA